MILTNYDCMRGNEEECMVHSDIATLKKVIVHLPDEGIEWVTPTNKDFLLYDDIVYLPAMIEEHKVLQNVLKAFVGKENVLDIEDMLVEVLRDTNRRLEMIQAVEALENLDKDTVQVLQDLDYTVLAQALIRGYKMDSKPIITPLPNLIFTRDIGAMVNDHLLICHATKSPRKRENLITWMVLRYHPLFSDFRENDRYLDVSGDLQNLVSNLQKGTYSVEGGDINILNENHLIIACSERTNLAALHLLRDIAFEKNVVGKFTIIDIPKEEYCMHIDTIFSQVAEKDFVIFDKLLMDPEQVSITQYLKGQQDPVTFENVEELLLAEYPDARFIHCGNGQAPHDEREQWTMACNTVALKPGVAITYGRNTRTLEAFEEKGYKTVFARDLLAAIESGVLDPETIENTIIRIPAGELSRGGGGPHCLTFPIHRV